MGGSGSGGWSPTTPAESCESIQFRANINSPQAEALEDLSLGDKLTISLQQAPNISLIVSKDDSVVGTLTGFSMSRIIRCIENGHLYSATVVELDGGSCTVQVELA